MVARRRRVQFIWDKVTDELIARSSKKVNKALADLINALGYKEHQWVKDSYLYDLETYGSQILTRLKERYNDFTKKNSGSVCRRKVQSRQRGKVASSQRRVSKNSRKSS